MSCHKLPSSLDTTCGLSKRAWFQLVRWHQSLWILIQHGPVPSLLLRLLWVHRRHFVHCDRENRRDRGDERWREDRWGWLFKVIWNSCLTKKSMSEFMTGPCCIQSSGPLNIAGGLVTHSKNIMGFICWAIFLQNFFQFLKLINYSGSLTAGRCWCSGYCWHPCTSGSRRKRFQRNPASSGILSLF